MGRKQQGRQKTGRLSLGLLFTSGENGFGFFSVWSGKVDGLQQMRVWKLDSPSYFASRMSRDIP